MRNGAIDDALDAGVFENGQTLHCPSQPRHQAIEIIGKQFAVRFPGRVTVRRPGFGHLFVFVNADESALLFLSNISRCARITNDWNFLVAFNKLRNVPGDYIVVLHIDQGHVATNHLRDLARITTAGVHDDFSDDIALLGDDLPVARWPQLDVEHTIVALDRCAHVARPTRHRIGES